MGWKMRKDKLQSDQPDAEASQDEEYQEQEHEIEADASAMARLAQLSADTDGSAFVLDLDKETFRTDNKRTSLDPSEFAWFNDAPATPPQAQPQRAPAPGPPQAQPQRAAAPTPAPQVPPQRSAPTPPPAMSPSAVYVDPSYNAAAFTPAPPPAYNRADYQQPDYLPPSFDTAPAFAEQRPAFDPGPAFGDQRQVFDPTPAQPAPFADQRQVLDVAPAQPAAFADPRPAFDPAPAPPAAARPVAPTPAEESVQWNGPQKQTAAPAWAQPEPEQPIWAQEPAPAFGAPAATPPPAFADPGPAFEAPMNGHQAPAFAPAAPAPAQSSEPAWAQEPSTPFGSPADDQGPFGAPAAPPPSAAPARPAPAAYTPTPAPAPAAPSAQYQVSSNQSPYASHPSAPPAAAPPAAAPYSSQPVRPNADGQNISSFSRDSVAAGLVAGEGDFAIPKVAPFIVAGGSQPEEVVTATGDHYLILRIRNLSSSYKLTKDITTIGRPDSITKNYPDIEVDLDDGVSRKHAEVRKQGNDFFVVDVGSTNGTLLNGDILDVNIEMKLAHGDRIRVGEKTEIVFE